MGQTRPVTVWRTFCIGTLESYIASTANTKTDLATTLLSLSERGNDDTPARAEGGKRKSGKRVRDLRSGGANQCAADRPDGALGNAAARAPPPHGEST